MREETPETAAPIRAAVSRTTNQGQFARQNASNAEGSRAARPGGAGLVVERLANSRPDPTAAGADDGARGGFVRAVIGPAFRSRDEPHVRVEHPPGDAVPRHLPQILERLLEIRDGHPPNVSVAMPVRFELDPPRLGVVRPFEQKQREPRVAVAENRESVSAVPGFDPATAGIDRRHVTPP